MKSEIKEMSIEEIPLMVNYFVDADRAFLLGMGADKSKLPSKEEWIAKLEADLIKSAKEKEFYYLTWLVDGKAIGHCNINKIDYANKAFMHLHLWNPDKRKKGVGSQLVKMSIPIFFKEFELKKLLCEPFAYNPAPNKVLQKLGFRFIKAYETTPGWINIHQMVNCYEFTREMLKQLASTDKNITSININGKCFISMENSANGEVSSETIFTYRQKNNIIWATYEGGEVIFGTLSGRIDGNKMVFTYQHQNLAGEFMTGKCNTTIKEQNNKLMLYEEWEWTCKDYSKGTSVLIEI